MIRLSRSRRQDYFHAMTAGWVIAAILFLGAVIALYLIKQTQDLNFHLCLLRQSTGIRCPLCGGTTTAMLLANGLVGDAFRQNPLVATGIILFTLWSALWLGAGWRIQCTLHPKTSLALGLVILGLNWAYVLANATG